MDGWMDGRMDGTRYDTTGVQLAHDVFIFFFNAQLRNWFFAPQMAERRHCTALGRLWSEVLQNATTMQVAWKVSWWWDEWEPANSTKKPFISAHLLIDKNKEYSLPTGRTEKAIFHYTRSLAHRVLLATDFAWKYRFGAIESSIHLDVMHGKSLH